MYLLVYSSSTKGCVGGDNNAFLLTKVYEVAVGKVRVNFDLQTIAARLGVLHRLSSLSLLSSQVKCSR